VTLVEAVAAGYFAFDRGFVAVKERIIFPAFAEDLATTLIGHELALRVQALVAMPPSDRK